MAGKIRMQKVLNLHISVKRRWSSSGWEEAIRCTGWNIFWGEGMRLKRTVMVSEKNSPKKWILGR